MYTISHPLSLVRSQNCFVRGNTQKCADSICHPFWLGDKILITHNMALFWINLLEESEHVLVRLHPDLLGYLKCIFVLCPDQFMHPSTQKGFDSCIRVTYQADIFRPSEKCCGTP